MKRGASTHYRDAVRHLDAANDLDPVPGDSNTTYDDSIERRLDQVVLALQGLTHATLAVAEVTINANGYTLMDNN